MLLFGHNYQGALAEYATIPENAMYVLKTDLAPRYASIMEPFGVALRCVEEVRAKNDTLLVIGVGPIGLAAIPIAAHYGAKRILAVDVSDQRLAVAQQLGAHAILNTAPLQPADILKWVLNETNGDGVGNVIEASGAPVMVNNMTQWLRKASQCFFFVFC